MSNAATLPGTAPTPGQLALAQAIAEGCTRTNRGITTVPAAVYTDPEHWTREQATLFERLPQVLCPSALLPEPNMAVPHDSTGQPLLITEHKFRVKRFPTCGAIHRAMDGMLELRAAAGQGIGVEIVASPALSCSCSHAEASHLAPCDPRRHRRDPGGSRSPVGRPRSVRLARAPRPR